MSVVVRLDDAHIGAGPGTVVAVVESVAEYYALVRDRDGAVDSRMRLWSGEFSVGSRVRMKQLVCGTGEGVFEEVK